MIKQFIRADTFEELKVLENISRLFQDITVAEGNAHLADEQSLVEDASKRATVCGY